MGFTSLTSLLNGARAPAEERRRAVEEPTSFDDPDEYLDALQSGFDRGAERANEVESERPQHETQKWGSWNHDDESDSVLDDGKDIVEDRENKHGSPEETHTRIARMWEAYLGLKPGDIKAHDAAVMVDILKSARIRENPERRDNWVDKAGYAECGWRCVDGGGDDE